MTEREKMVAGAWYDPTDSELEEMRRRIRDLFYDYNLTREGEGKRRAALCKEMLGGCGENVQICPPVRFDYGCNTFVGDRFFSNFNLTVLDVAPVTVGRDVYARDERRKASGASAGGRALVRPGIRQADHGGKRRVDRIGRHRLRRRFDRRRRRHRGGQRRNAGRSALYFLCGQSLPRDQKIKIRTGGRRSPDRG